MTDEQKLLIFMAFELVFVVVGCFAIGLRDMKIRQQATNYKDQLREQVKQILEDLKKE